MVQVRVRAGALLHNLAAACEEFAHLGIVPIKQISCRSRIDVSQI
jgi:hypothetical protein